MKNELTEYAVFDHLQLTLKDLFLSPSKNAKNQRMHIIKEYGQYQVEVRGFSQLTAFDLSLLQSLIALAGCKKIALNADIEGENGKLLRKELNLGFDSETKLALVINTSYRQLAAEMGKAYSGKFSPMIEESLKNIGTTVFFITKNDKSQKFQFNMISSIKIENSASLTIALNPELVDAIFGTRNFAKINMNENRQLKNDVLRLLHSKLSALIKPGGERNFTPETLSSYIWLDDVSKDAQYKRVSRLKNNLLPKLKDIGWSAFENGDKILIRRPQEKTKKEPKQLKLL